MTHGNPAMTEYNELQSRLKNCLQTILEFEADIEALPAGETLLKEFAHLKDFLARLNQLAPVEEDVLRIERTTAVLLRELERPLSMLRERRVIHRLLQ